MISVSKSLMSFSLNTIARFLNFALKKTGNIKFNTIGMCIEGDKLVVCSGPGNCQCGNKNLCGVQLLSL